MAQFDVYKNKSAGSRAVKPYYVDVQSSLLEGLSSRAVIPLVLEKCLPHPIQFLNPSFTVENNTVYLSTAEITSISNKSLGDKIINLSSGSEAILNAVEFLICGI